MTVIEMMLVITIGYILYATTMPNLNQWINRQLIHYETNKLYQLIHRARHTAIINKSNIILCSIDDQQQCNNNWQDPIILFEDNDNNKSYTPIDNLIFKTTTIPSLRKQYSRNKIRFNPQGQAYGYNGTFVICHQNIISRGIIIAGTGRIRFAVDNDLDDLVEDWRGDNLSCQ